MHAVLKCPSSVLCLLVKYVFDCPCVMQPFFGATIDEISISPYIARCTFSDLVLNPFFRRRRSRNQQEGCRVVVQIFAPHLSFDFCHGFDDVFCLSRVAFRKMCHTCNAGLDTQLHTTPKHNKKILFILPLRSCSK